MTYVDKHRQALLVCRYWNYSIVFEFVIVCPLAEYWIQADFQQQGLDELVGYEGERKKILVVDDRWENRSVIVNLLTPLGFELYEAQNGQDGLIQAKLCLPDLIITDLLMPRLNGYGLLKQIRATAELKTIWTIASSAHLSGLDHHESISAGFDGFLAKPIQIKELLDQLQQRLNLTWKYKTEEVPTAAAPAMVVPSSEELIALYEIAEKGYISEIQIEVERIQQLDPSYQIFTAKLLKLVDEFDDEAIVQLIKPYIHF